MGLVNYSTSERVIEAIKERMIEDPHAPVYLSVTSAGGTSGTAMSFYDHMREILRPDLVTIGSGDVDSSGVILFLSGRTRYVTKHTTMLLHPAGRTFEEGKRYTAREHDAMMREDRLKDMQYATIVAENSNGSLSPEMVLELMEQHTILTPADLLFYGLVTAVLG